MGHLAKLILFAIGFAAMLLVASSAFELINTYLYNLGYYDVELYDPGRDHA